MSLSPKSKAVILLNFGGPRSLNEVSSFLFEILRDPHVIQLPFPQAFQNLLARKLATKRAPEVQKQYAAIGGKSPIVESTELQRLQLEKTLRRKGVNLPLYVIHRYLRGQAEQVAQLLLKEGHDALYLIPLYPHFSWTTTGSSVEQIVSTLQSLSYEGSIHALRSYPNHPLYISALSDQINRSLQTHKLRPEETLILCSAHGVPKSYIQQGDPYLTELLLTTEELRQQFPQWKIKLSFQSKVGPAEWLKPYTNELISELPEQGIRSLLFVGLSFVNDHLETQYEIDTTYFELSRSVGLQPYRVSAIESHEYYIELLAQKTIAWSQGAQGWELEHLLPPSQTFKRYHRWILLLGILCVVISLFFALV
ncbi:ferrochelatase [Deltaproteobacteria bacterium TL4]